MALYRQSLCYNQGVYNIEQSRKCEEKQYLCYSIAVGIYYENAGPELWYSGISRGLQCWHPIISTSPSLSFSTSNPAPY